MSKFAWVTLATNDSYSLGALVVAFSLRRVNTAHQLAVLITPGVSEAMRVKLGTVFNLVQEVNVLDSADHANLALLARPELGVTFTKLHCWKLTQFEKCVFLDADTLVLQNCDELFEREELSAAPDVGWPDCFNSGVFVFRPSLDTFGKLLDFAIQKGSFDGGDQGLLNFYFSDWATKDISKHLPFVYNTCSTACYSYMPAFKQFGANVKILHFIGPAKPWLQNFDSQTRQVQTPGNLSHLHDFLQYWWTIFFDDVHPNLTPEMPELVSKLRTVEENDYQQNKSKATVETSWHEASYNNPYPDSFNPDNSLFTSHTEMEFKFYDPWEEYEEKRAKENEIERINRKHEQQLNSRKYEKILEKKDEYIFPGFIETQNFLSNIVQSACTYQFGGSDNNSERIINKAKTIIDDNSIFRNNEKLPEHSYSQTFNESIKSDSIDIYNKNINIIIDDILVKTTKEFNNLQLNGRSMENIFHETPFTASQSLPPPPPSPSFSSISTTQSTFHHDISFDLRPQSFESHPPPSQSPLLPPPPLASVPLIENHSSSFTQFVSPSSSLPSQPPPSPSSQPPPSTPSPSSPPSPSLSSSPKSANDEFQSPPKSTTTIQTVNSITETSKMPEIEQEEVGLAGALAKITLGEARTPEQEAYELQLRRQCWEAGNIDYMGKDSFENIWRRISQTLEAKPSPAPSSSGPPREPSPPKRERTPTPQPEERLPVETAKKEVRVETSIEEHEEEEGEVRHSPGNNPGQSPGNNPGHDSGNNPGHGPGENPGNNPDHNPGENPRNNPDPSPGNNPGHDSGNNPGHGPGDNPGHGSGENPGNNPGHNLGGNPGNNPGHNPGNNPDHSPGDNPGHGSGNNPGHNPGNNPGHNPGNNPGHNPGKHREGGVEKIITTVTPDGKTIQKKIITYPGEETEVIEEEHTQIVGGVVTTKATTSTPAAIAAPAPATQPKPTEVKTTPKSGAKSPPPPFVPDPTKDVVEFDPATNTTTVTRKTATGYEQILTIVLPDGRTKTQTKTFYDPVEKEGDVEEEEEIEEYEETHEQEATKKTTTTTTSAPGAVPKKTQEVIVPAVKEQVKKTTTDVQSKQTAQQQTIEEEVTKTTTTVTTEVLEETKVAKVVPSQQTVVSKLPSGGTEEITTTVTPEGQKKVQKTKHYEAEEMDIEEYEETQVSAPGSKKTTTTTTTAQAKQVEKPAAKPEQKPAKPETQIVAVPAKDRAVVPVGDKPGDKLIARRTVTTGSEELEITEESTETEFAPSSKTTTTTTHPSGKQPTAQPQKQQQPAEPSLAPKAGPKDAAKAEPKKDPKASQKPQPKTAPKEESQIVAKQPEASTVIKKIPTGKQEITTTVTPDGKTQIVTKTKYDPEVTEEVEEYEETHTFEASESSKTQTTSTTTTQQAPSGGKKPQAQPPAKKPDPKAATKTVDTKDTKTTTKTDKSQEKTTKTGADKKTTTTTQTGPGSKTTTTTSSTPGGKATTTTTPGTKTTTTTQGQTEIVTEAVSSEGERQTIVTRQIEGGREIITTTYRADGTTRTETRTQFDPVFQEGSSEEEEIEEYEEIEEGEPVVTTTTKTTTTVLPPKKVEPPAPAPVSEPAPAPKKAKSKTPSDDVGMPKPLKLSREEEEEKAKQEKEKELPSKLKIPAAFAAAAEGPKVPSYKAKKKPAPSAPSSEEAAGPVAPPRGAKKVTKK